MVFLGKSLFLRIDTAQPMRQHYFFPIFPLLIAVLALCSCQGRQVLPHAMQQAENVMAAHPDSAYQFLLSMENDLASYPQETQMYYQLLKIQSEDKQDILHLSDSLINSIVSFYEGYGNRDKLMKAYFYQGSVYRDMGDAVRELKGFQKCIDVGRNSGNRELLGQAYGQVSSLYLFMNLFEESKTMSDQALKVYLELENPKRIAGTYNKMGRIFYAMGIEDSSSFYFNKAIDLYEQNNLTANANSSRIELAVLYRDYEYFDKADSLYRSLLNNGVKSNNLYLGYSLLFSKFNNTDSVAKYLMCINPEGFNIYAQQNYAKLLSDYHKMNGNKDKAIEELEKAVLIGDSINRFEKTDAVGHLHTLYDYDQWKLQTELALQHSRNYLLLVLLISVVSSCVIVFIVYLLWKNNRELADREARLRVIQKQSLDKRQKISNNNMVRDLNSKAIGMTQNDDWTEWMTAFEQVYPLFIPNIRLLCPSLTDREILACCLTKLSVANNDMADIFFVTASGATKLKSRIYLKLGNSKGSKLKLEDFLKTL